MGQRHATSSEIARSHGVRDLHPSGGSAPQVQALLPCLLCHCRKWGPERVTLWHVSATAILWTAYVMANSPYVLQQAQRRSLPCRHDSWFPGWQQHKFLAAQIVCGVTSCNSPVQRMFVAAGAGVGPAVPSPQPVSRARVMELPRPAKPKEAGSSRPAAHPTAAAPVAEPAASDSASSDCEIIDCEEFLASAAPTLAAPARVPGSQPSDSRQPSFQQRGDGHSARNQHAHAVQERQALQHGAGRVGSAGGGGSNAAAAAAAAQRQQAPGLPPLPPRQLPAPAVNASGGGGAVHGAAPAAENAAAAAANAAAPAAAAADPAGPAAAVTGASAPGSSRSGVLSAGRPLLPPLVDPVTGTEPNSSSPSNFRKHTADIAAAC